MSLAYSLLFALAGLHVGTTLLDVALVALQLALVFLIFGERIVYFGFGWLIFGECIVYLACI